MAGTITHKWNGTILTVTSDSGTSSCDLKGAQGDMGIRGAQGAPGCITDTTGLILAEANNYYLKEQVDDAIGAAKEEVEDRVSALETNTTNSILALENTADNHNKRITNLEHRLSGAVFTTDSTIDYSKEVPEDVLTYAEVTRVGGMSHREDNTLKDAAVTQIRATGANLVNLSDCTENIVNYYYKDTPLNFQFESNTTYTVTMNYKVNSTNMTTLKLGIGYGSIGYQAGLTERSYPNLTSGTITMTFTTPTEWRFKPFAWVRLVRGDTAHTSNVDISNFMMCKGSVALPYEPYKESTLEIPTEVQALDGYGYGVNDTYCNYINWQPGNYIKTYNKNVKKQIFNKIQGFYSCLGGNSTKHYVKLGTIENGDFLLPHTNDHVYTLISNRYDATKAYNTARGLGGNSISVEASQNALGTGSILVYDETLQTEAAWNAKLATEPIEVVYVVNPIVTDISNLLPEDNFIEVTSGGVVVADNANKLAAPTTITYQTKEGTV